MTKPRIGISACLLGRKVRHNGEDKRNDWIVDQLGKFVTWVPLCPEVEMGLGVPRPTMRLKGKPADPQLIVKGSEENLTSLAQNTARRLLEEDLELDSFIFKKDSPSCGLERVKIYGKNDSPSRSAVGFFARAFTEKYPWLPVIEEGRLSDPRQRELYVVRLFGFVRLRHLARRISALQKFHQDYKFLLLAHAPDSYQSLGKLAANAGKLKPEEVFVRYEKLFLESMNRLPTRKQWINVLQHMLGFFKEKLSSGEKQQILTTIEEYRDGAIPLVALLTLIRHLAVRHSVSYLLDQAVFEPYPRGLRVTDQP